MYRKKNVKRRSNISVFLLKLLVILTLASVVLGAIFTGYIFSLSGHEYVFAESPVAFFILLTLYISLAVGMIWRINR